MSDITHKAQGRSCHEGVHNGGVGIRDNEHIAFIDRLKSAHAGAVERFPFYKRLKIKLVQWHAEVLPCTGNVNELEIHHLCVILFGKLQYRFWGHYLSLLPFLSRLHCWNIGILLNRYIYVLCTKMTIYQPLSEMIN